MIACSIGQAEFRATSDLRRGPAAMADGSGNNVNLPGAVYSYNHADWYVNAVLTLAARYAATIGVPSPPP